MTDEELIATIENDDGWPSRLSAPALAALRARLALPVLRTCEACAYYEDGGTCIASGTPDDLDRETLGSAAPPDWCPLRPRSTP